MKTKTFFIILNLIAITIISSYKGYSLTNDGNTLRIVYITDLNLYPTPTVSNREMHILEKTYGLLIYETQAIFQQIVGYINKKFDFDFVVFGGNNIFDCSKYNCRSEYPWQLFFDMVYEIKSEILFNFGENEARLFKFNDFINTLSTYKVDIQNTWWSKDKGDFLLVGLNSFYFFSNDTTTAIKQLKWLKDLLKKNKNKLTIIFMHEAPINENSAQVQSKFIAQLMNLIKSNSQIKLVVSQNQYLDRKHIIGKTVFILSPSPVRYPCGFKLIEITKKSLRVKTVYIPLKGIIKKAEKSLLFSDKAISTFPNNTKSMKIYVLGTKSDTDFEVLF